MHCRACTAACCLAVGWAPEAGAPVVAAAAAGGAGKELAEFAAGGGGGRGFVLWTTSSSVHNATEKSESVRSAAVRCPRASRTVPFLSSKRVWLASKRTSGGSRTKVTSTS